MLTAKRGSAVRFTWNILYDCNYRCSYCFFEGKWAEYKKRNVYLSADEWLRLWSKISQRYEQLFLIITGGEPFIYPNFIEIIQELSKICFQINISTNASRDLDRFVQEVNPEQVSLSLSFQKEFDSLEDFIRKVKLIRDHHFQGCLNMVAYPPFLETLQGEKQKLMHETGEQFKIIPFFGEYDNLSYPESYSEDERKLIGIDQSWYKKVRRKGQLCLAGHSSALLFPDGKVARCGQIGERLVIGNFFEPDFQLFNQAMVCDAEYCPCQEDNICGDDFNGPNEQ